MNNFPVGRRPEAESPAFYDDETLIRDDRAGMTTSQFVEHKLALAAKTSLPISHLQTARFTRP